MDMDWIVGFQKALDYIELHITEKIDYEEIAKISYSSSYHFQRVFCFADIRLANISVKDAYP